jgi:hypothetical protein
VATGEHRYEHPLDHPVLPDDHLLDFEEGAFQERRVLRRGRQGLSGLGRGWGVGRRWLVGHRISFGLDRHSFELTPASHARA